MENTAAEPADYSGVWISQARELVDRIATTQLSAISELAQWCSETIAGGGLVHLFGSGHSRIPVEEMFPRYGSFPGFNPISELSMTFHTEVVGTNGQRQAMFIERVEGLADVILSNFNFGPDDIMIVFSSSGRSAVPVEMAIGARRLGLRVAAVTSVSESMARPATHPTGSRLLDHADIVIDTCTPVGDAMVEVEGLDTPVGPGSTVSNAVVVNELKTQVAARLVAAGFKPSVLTASSVVGEEASERLFNEAYADHSHRIARVLDRQSGQS